MPEKLWKRVERLVARWLGGERKPITGREGPDIEHPWLAPEVKERKELPQWLTQAMNQAVIGAPTDKLPIVVLHEKGKWHGHDLVIVRMREFRMWFHPYEEAPDHD